mgnify:CR=1 FL=1
MAYFYIEIIFLAISIFSIKYATNFIYVLVVSEKALLCFLLLRD